MLPSLCSPKVAVPNMGFGSSISNEKLTFHSFFNYCRKHSVLSQVHLEEGKGGVRGQTSVANACKFSYIAMQSVLEE